MSARRIFRPPWWATVLTAVGVAAFSAFGVWQTHRGRDKAELRRQLEQAPADAAPLSAATAPSRDLAVRRVAARGRYLGGHTLLQDGQSHRRQPGHHVWTPLRLTDGALALVNRGWIPLAGGALAAPAGEVVVRGLWRSLPQPGLRLGAVDNCPAEKKFPAIVLYPTAGEVACLLGEPVLDGLLLLDAAEPGGFVREWAVTRFPPERHYAYAAQWFALAAAALVLYAVLNLKRAP